MQWWFRSVFTSSTSIAGLATALFLSFISFPTQSCVYLRYLKIALELFFRFDDLLGNSQATLSSEKSELPTG
jgi:hypothetical protein